MKHTENQAILFLFCIHLLALSNSKFGNVQCIHEVQVTLSSFISMYNWRRTTGITSFVSFGCNNVFFPGCFFLHCTDNSGESILQYYIYTLQIKKSKIITPRNKTNNLFAQEKYWKVAVCSGLVINVDKEKETESRVCACYGLKIKVCTHWILIWFSWSGPSAGQGP